MMGKVIAEITMSLDGFIAGPGITHKEPMGRNGQVLHEWIFNKATEADKKWLDELMYTTGTVILGHHTYSTAIDDAWGGGSPFSAIAFVLCHSLPAKPVRGFVYVTGGIEEALIRAKGTAAGKNIWVMGGASVIQQYVKAGLIEELRLHIVPVLLMEGTRLFENIGCDPVEWIKEPVTDTPGAVHIVLRAKK
ncbi:MAG: dihydrofolate reductase family protein [Bacteroidota bacterium]